MVVAADSPWCGGGGGRSLLFGDHARIHIKAVYIVSSLDRFGEKKERFLSKKNRLYAKNKYQPARVLASVIVRVGASVFM